MARRRILHPEQSADEKVCACSIPARYVWAMLPCYADREGLLLDEPFRLKLAILPVDQVDMNALLSELAAKELILRYEADGRRCIKIVTFHRYQRPHINEAKSTLPLPASQPKKPAETVATVPQCNGSTLNNQGSALDDHGSPMINHGTALTAGIRYSSLSLDSPSLSAPPDPDRACARSNPGAKSAFDWLTYYNARFFETKGRQRGCSSDAKATANLEDVLRALPEAERSEDWQARERIVDEFLARADQRTVEAGWKFAFFVSSFDGLRLPPEKRPTVRDGPGKAGNGGKPYYDPGWRKANAG